MLKFKNLGLHLVIVSVLSTGFLFCDSDSSDNESSTSITVSTSPAAGSTLTSGSTIVGTIQYTIKDFDSANYNYLVKVWFKKSSGFGSSDTSFTSSYVLITASSGSATLSYAISNEFNDKATYIQPRVIKYSLHEYSKSATLPSIDWDATCLALSPEITFGN